jgi:hypothetical protein
MCMCKYHFSPHPTSIKLLWLLTLSLATESSLKNLKTKII